MPCTSFPSVRTPLSSGSFKRPVQRSCSGRRAKSDLCLNTDFFRLLHVTDWLPTLYSAAGGDAAADLPADLDGVDQWASLVEAREPSARQVVQGFTQRPAVRGCEIFTCGSEAATQV